MDDPGAERERAKQFADQVKIKLSSEFGDKIDWENDSPPSLKFLVKTDSKNYEMRLEYKTGDSFLLYDRDVNTQTGDDLGKFSSENITTPNDPTPSKVVDKVISHVS